MNMTEDRLKEQFARRSSIRALVDKDIAPKVKVTEKEAKDFYDTNPNFFEQPEQVRASHILIKVKPGASDQEKAEARKKLADIKKEIDAGKDFAELAKTHSEDMSNARGGDLGYFTKGRMVPPFEEKAFSMKPNEVSDIVETQFGLHLIKVSDRKEAGKVNYKEAEPKIIDNLRNQQIQEKLVAYLSELRKDAKIEKFIDQTK
jgi:peptidyl-prolyl cis-trans isomerase C